MAAGNEVGSRAEALRLDCRTSFPGGSSFECYSLASLILLSNLVLHPFPFHNCTSTSTSDWEQQLYIHKKPSFPHECSNWCTGLLKKKICVRNCESESQREEYKGYLSCKSVESLCETLNVHSH